MNPTDFLYSNEAAISKMIFTECRKENAPECPYGAVCPQCGLLQGEEDQTCLFCGQRLIGTVQ